MDLLRTAAVAQYKFEHQMLELNGYQTKTTFFSDFTIADAFGEAAVIDTFERSFASFNSNVVYMTELSMVLNHKLWEMYHAKNETLMNVYDTLWKKTDEYCINTFKDSDLEYFLRTTD